MIKTPVSLKLTSLYILAQIALFLFPIQSMAEQDIKEYNATIRNIELFEDKIDLSEKKQKEISRKIASYGKSVSQNKKNSTRLNEIIVHHQKTLATQLRQIQKLQQHALLKRIADPYSYNQTQRHIELIKQFPRMHINTIVVLEPLEKQYKQENKKLTDTLQKSKNEQKKLKKIKKMLVAEKGKLKSQISRKKKLLNKASVRDYSREKANQQVLKKLERTNLKHYSSLKHFRNYKGKLQWPTLGKVKRSKLYGKHSWEITNKQSAPVQVIAPGKIEYIGRADILGKIIIVNHGGNYRSIYTHIDSVKVKEGQIVRAQQVICQSGKTGGREDYGISFELRYGKNKVNFYKWLQNVSL